MTGMTCGPSSFYSIYGAMVFVQERHKEPSLSAHNVYKWGLWNWLIMTSILIVIVKLIQIHFKTENTFQMSNPREECIHYALAFVGFLLSKIRVMRLTRMGKALSGQ